MTKTIPISDVTLTESEISAAVEVLRSGNLRQGKKCQAFEAEFAEAVGAAHAVSCANGSAALHLAYAAVLEPGDEILVPDFTFIATASMASLTGVTPVFCDVDLDSFHIDLTDAESKVSDRTKAIAPVHLFGNVVDLEAVHAFADRHDLFVIWDGAQSHGALYKGRPIGGEKDFVTYSFYPSKNMYVGEGGMVCTESKDMAERLRLLRSHGASGKYVHTVIGFNYRMTDIEASIGREQLKRLDSMIEVRRRNAQIYDETLSGIAGLRLPKVDPNVSHSYHQYCICIESDNAHVSRDMMEDALRQNQIQCGIHYPRGLHQQPVYQGLNRYNGYPNSERLAREILAIPVHHGLEEQDVHTVSSVIRSLFEKAGA